MSIRASRIGRSRPATPAAFIDEYYEKLRQVAPQLEMDFSFSEDCVMLHDMAHPSAIRRGKLYSTKEIEDGVFIIVGDFERRVQKFLEGGR